MKGEDANNFLINRVSSCSSQARVWINISLASSSPGTLMLLKHRHVSVHSEVNSIDAFANRSFVDPFCYVCFSFTFVMLSCLFPAFLWSATGKWLTSWFFYVLCFLVFLSLSHIVPRSGVVLDCTDSWSLHFYPLFLTYTMYRHN